MLTAPHPLELSSLDGSNGFVLNGIDAGDRSGYDVDSAGDINGDGFDDLIIGADAADPNGEDRAGESYIVFGKGTGFSSSLNLSTLDGSNGFVINGIGFVDYSGRSVSGAGDVNGDGLDDVIVGAGSANANGRDTGESYVVFGKTSGFSASLDLATLDGNNGFAIRGIDAEDFSGRSVSGAGDVNGDGLNDLIIGAVSADPNGDFSGESYVVFGRPNGFSPVLDLSSLDGTNGFVVNGIDAGDYAGRTVSGAGDINGDGFDDFIIGANGADPAGVNGSGEAYVVFGKPDGFAAALELSTLNGSNGFVINGIGAYDGAGERVRHAGDVNGDGLDDLIIGAWGADRTERDFGQSYVVFGRSTGFGAALELSELDGTNGFAINGIVAFDRSGRGVSGAGDVNGDGFDDLIIGADGADPNGGNSGESYVLFGKSSGFSSAIDLSTLDGDNGFALLGISVGDNSGRRVNSAGDVNGDGFADLIIGANAGDPNGNDSGESYLVFGGNFTGGVETQVGDDSANSMMATQGPAATDILIGGDGNDTLISDGGADVLLGGSGDDNLSIPNVDFNSTRRLDGGNGLDTLTLAGADLHLDLTEIADNRIVDIEQIDITGSGDNTLSLNQLEVLNLSSHSNTLIVRGGAGDAVNLEPFWRSLSNENIDGTDFRVFSRGQAILKIEAAMKVSAVLQASSLNGFNGFTINGIDHYDSAGFSVSSAGDINGDGIDDVIIGARFADPSGINSGESYVVFGKTDGFESDLDLSGLDGSNGFVVNGIDAHDSAGHSVSGAGDINGDGIDDIVIGANSADLNNSSLNEASGETYVVFGRTTGFTAALELSSLDGSNGFVVNATESNEFLGQSVSNAGDINGDGIDDIIVGASRADNGPLFNSGEAYVVFGRDVGFDAAISVSNLDGSNGFAINGINSLDALGISVSAAGDVNGDGVDDLIAGAFQANANGSASGQSYVIFGRRTSFAANLPLSVLDASVGFAINGASAADQSGFSVSGAGDINGDGIDDIIIGAPEADPGGRHRAGESYVVFGDRGGFGASLELGSLDGSNGFVISGIHEADRSGYSVSGAGDINGDGIDDLVIGARDAGIYGARVGATRIGEAYVVFGKTEGFAANLELSGLDGINGFTVRGIFEFGYAGSSVSDAGDINGDGIDDVIIGAYGAATPGGRSGQSYVIFGQQVDEPPGNLIATHFDAETDHILDAETTVEFTVANVGGTSVGAFDTQIVWSTNDVLGDSDDMVVGGVQSFVGLSPGSDETREVTINFDKAAIFDTAMTADPGGEPIGRISQDLSRLFLIIDPMNSVEESVESNNSGGGLGVGSDDVTFFIWDTNGDETVTPRDALQAISRIGSSSATDARYDFGGNGVVTPLDALAVVQRIGYTINPAAKDDSMGSLTAAFNVSISEPFSSFTVDDREKPSLFAESRVSEEESPVLAGPEALLFADTAENDASWLDAIEGS